MMAAVLLALAVLSVLLNFWQWLAGRRFPIWRASSPSGPPRPLSILKPLKGADSFTEACLRSWFEQDYGAEVELLFGVADENDPACAIVRKLAREFPARRSKLVICCPILGSNAKVSSLCYLAGEAKHEYLVISDADVEIQPGFLQELTGPLERAALVNCFYVLRPLNTAMAIEAVAVNADFWTQVLQGNMIKRMDFALGAAIATTKKQLSKIGGFESLLHCLADDYQLGHRIAHRGGSLEICPIPVTCWNEEQSWAEVWEHQIRWARTVRVCQPVPYFFSILNNAALWPLLACAASPDPITKAVFWSALLFRALTAKINHARLARDNGWLAFACAPIRDVLGAAVWAASFLGNTVAWRGERYRVNRRGILTPAGVKMTTQETAMRETFSPF